MGSGLTIYTRVCKGWLFIFGQVTLSISIFRSSRTAQSSQSVDVGKAKILQTQLEQKSRQLHANTQELQRVNSEMEESRKSLEAELKHEKETRAELEVRLAVVEDELFEVKDRKEKLSIELTNLQGKCCDAVNVSPSTHTQHTHTHLV